MSPVDRGCPVSEISAHPLITLKNSRRVHISECSGSITGTLEPGRKFFPCERFGLVTGMDFFNFAAMFVLFLKFRV